MSVGKSVFDRMNDSIVPSKFRSSSFFCNVDDSVSEKEFFCPPRNNMGGIISSDRSFSLSSVVFPDSSFSLSFTSSTFVPSKIVVSGDYSIDSKYKIINTPNRNICADPNAGFIDWLSFTFNIYSFYDLFPDLKSISDDGEDLVCEISLKLESIFGFGITSERSTGMNFYKKSYILGDNWGNLCIGGCHQNNTCLVTITGSGFTAMKDLAWEKTAFDFLCALNARITRVDCTADFFEGEYNLDIAVKQLMNNEFDNGGSKVNSNQFGNWLRPDGKGRTLNIGSIKNGKELCIYEKGKQLGGKYAKSFKDWVRVELRLGSKDRVIPLDVLIYPGQYLSGGYKPLNFISVVQCKVKTSKAKFKVEYEKAKAVLKVQFGKLLFAIAGVEGSIASVVGDDIPDRLICPDIKNQFLNNFTVEDGIDVFSVDEDYVLENAF